MVSAYILQNVVLESAKPKNLELVKQNLLQELAKLMTEDESADPALKETLKG